MLDAPSLLTIDLNSIVSNYHCLQNQAGKSICAAVLKADAYGCGSAEVGLALYEAGCRHFFVAYTDEALVLRDALSSCQEKIYIYVLNGPYLKGWESFYKAHDLIPVLNNISEVEAWHTYAAQTNQLLPAVLHVNTGMHRYGLTDQDYQTFKEGYWPNIDLRLIMSHLSQSHISDHPTNAVQLNKMFSIQDNHPNTPLSLANSGGIFLGKPYHFDIVRPGVSLYGLNPMRYEKNVLKPCLNLEAKIIQIQNIEAGNFVGYSETFESKHSMRIATLAIGYADGIPWGISNKNAYVLVHGKKAPIVGRVSMDLTTIDVTFIPEAKVGDSAILLNQEITIDDWANYAGTINHEILVKLGKRSKRAYKKTTTHSGEQKV